MRIPKFIRKFLLKTFQKVRIIFYHTLSEIDLMGEKPLLRQPLQTAGKGVIELEENVSIGFYPSPFFFTSYAYLDARSMSARISIGQGTAINNGFVAIAEHTYIKIGKRVLIGTNVEIIDSDFHGINMSSRSMSRPEWAKPVVIEDDVFLGSNVRICKGVTIGEGSVVANGSIVVQSIPPGMIAAGNPANVIRSIK